MTWPPRVQMILNTLAALHPTWVADDTGPAPTPRFKFNTLFVEQVRYELGPAYGFKRADPGRPISSESLAMATEFKLLAWAWENQHNGQVEQFPESEDITGQVFVEATPVNHLGGAPPVEPPAPSAPAAGPYWGDAVSRAAFGQLIVLLLGDYARAGNPIDDGIGVWLGRTMYDVMTRGEAVATAVPRHRREWCAILGIPVI